MISAVILTAVILAAVIHMVILFTFLPSLQVAAVRELPFGSW